MRIEKRLRALEQRLITEPTVLFFDDGSTRQVCGRGHLLDLLLAALPGGNLTSVQAEQIDLVRRCKYAQEPGGSRLIELFTSLGTV